MAQAMINFRMDENLNKGMEQTCREMGMSMTTAFTLFATKVARERRIPFEITADPFYSPANMDRLKRAAAEMDAGLGTAHELIEDDGDD